jgi:hypothetical protein
MSTPLSLSDDQLDAIMRASAPLDPAQRENFLRDVVAELQKSPPGEIGSGSVYRAAREVQARYFQPLRTAHDSIIGKRP